MRSLAADMRLKCTYRARIVAHYVWWKPEAERMKEYECQCGPVGHPGRHGVEEGPLEINNVR